MKRIRIFTIFVLFVCLTLATAYPASAASNGLKISYNVTGGYKIAQITVSGYNQYGSWTNWTPPDSTGAQKLWKNGSCDYGTFSVCPNSIVTTDYWWTGKVYVSFTVVYWYDTNDIKQGTCEVNIPSSSWFSSIPVSVTYDPVKSTCSVR